MLLNIGLTILVIGIILFLIPMVLNKYEELAKIGFLVFSAGGFITIVGAVTSVLG